MQSSAKSIFKKRLILAMCLWINCDFINTLKKKDPLTTHYVKFRLDNKLRVLLVKSCCLHDHLQEVQLQIDKLKWNFL